MIIVLKTGVGNEQVDSLKNWLTEKGLTVSPIYGAEKTVLGLVGDTSHLSIDEVSMHEAVEKVLKVQEPYKKANRNSIPKILLLRLAIVSIGADLVAGSCLSSQRTDHSNCPSGEELWGQYATGRRFQASHITVCIPGVKSRRAHALKKSR